MQVKADAYEKIDKELLEFVEDVLLNRCDNATERMLEYAATLEPKCKPTDVRKKGQVRGLAPGIILPCSTSCMYPKSEVLDPPLCSLHLLSSPCWLQLQCLVSVLGLLKLLPALMPSRRMNST